MKVILKQEFVKSQRCNPPLGIMLNTKERQTSQRGMKMQKALKLSESQDNNIFHPRRLGALVQAQNDGKGEKVMKKETRVLHFSH